MTDMFWSAVEFRLGWMAVEVGLFLLVCAILFLPKMIQQARCKHEKYFENGACHAICSNCRADLGFIGTVREEREKSNVL